MIFAVKHGSIDKMLEIDFIESLLIVKQKDSLIKKYHLKMITRVINAFKYDEFIIEFKDEAKSMVC
jgi:hypothetical protein